MTVVEVLETTRIHSVAGLTGDRTALVTISPCRAPHHTISDVGLIGGGNVPMPGDVSLAHHGMLLRNERPEFRRHVLEVLRQPLEEGLTRIPLPTHPSHTKSTPPLRPWGMTPDGPAQG
jgi:magnesium chelatase family protein